MATVKVPPGSIYRQPSFRGRVYFSVINGRIVAKAWPRKAATKPTAKQIAARDRFKQLAQAAKRITPQELDWAIAASGTSRFLWRDVYYMSLSGRLWYIPLKGEGTLYSMAQYADLTSLLDIAGQLPGATLYRGVNGWTSIPAGTPGQVLTVDATGFPYWADSSGGGGAQFFYSLRQTAISTTAFATKGNSLQPLVDITIPRVMVDATYVNGGTYVARLYSRNGSTLVAKIADSTPVTIPAAFIDTQFFTFPIPLTLLANQQYFLCISRTDLTAVTPVTLGTRSQSLDEWPSEYPPTPGWIASIDPPDGSVIATLTTPYCISIIWSLG